MKTAQTLEINKVHWPVTVLGPGRRIGIWVQGCSIHCPGCVSQDTWDRDSTKSVPVADLLAWCRHMAPQPDGVTISGGEPFEQSAGLVALLQGFAQWRRAADLDFDVLCYSGYSLSRLQRDHAKLLALLDAIIPEPYVGTRPMTQLWRGSSNQSLVALTARGQARYTAYIDAPAESAGKRMQAAVEGGRVWMIGRPARGDMARVEALCVERGLKLEKVSWRR
jgi:anaerobic ribonucleoside-triphosphate reductase activating protein